MGNSKLFKKVYGCLLGGAIGDALGGPVEGPKLIEIGAGVRAAGRAVSHGPEALRARWLVTEPDGVAKAVAQAGGMMSSSPLRMPTESPMVR